jgi:hypothetical protein
MLERLPSAESTVWCCSTHGKNHTPRVWWHTQAGIPKPQEVHKDIEELTHELNLE